MSTIIEDRPKAEYGCAQQDLYTVATTVRQSYLDHLVDFTNHNTLYDLGYGTLLGTRIADARNLPEDDARTAVHAVLHIELQRLGVTGIVKWQQLETAIGKSSDAETVAQRLLEAGKGYYTEAYNEDWDLMKGLLTAAIQFVANHATVLGTGGLPAGVRGRKPFHFRPEPQSDTAKDTAFGDSDRSDSADQGYCGEWVRSAAANLARNTLAITLTGNR